MSSSRCPRCARSYTPGEVTGSGVLRTRQEHQGGPLLEFTCPGCGKLLRLIPHGWGRYAAPGAPPPPIDPTASRAPPWADTDPKPEPKPNAGPRGPTVEESPAATYEIPDPRSPDEPPPTSRGGGPPEPEIGEHVTAVAEAFEVLGIEPTAHRQDIDHAFRERSRTCHPDKVAHLDEEFLRLAERKFRRLKSAYDLLCTKIH